MKKKVIKYALVVAKYAITLLIGWLGGESLTSCVGVM